MGTTMTKHDKPVAVKSILNQALDIIEPFMTTEDFSIAGGLLYRLLQGKSEADWKPTDNHGLGVVKTDPTIPEIHEACELIQKSWTDEQRASRKEGARKEALQELRGILGSVDNQGRWLTAATVAANKAARRELLIHG